MSENIAEGVCFGCGSKGFGYGHCYACHKKQEALPPRHGYCPPPPLSPLPSVEWGDPPPLPNPYSFQMPTPGSKEWDALFSRFVTSHCALLPRGVRSMTFAEFCQDVAEGLR